jgi:hypothetical protein
MKIKIITFLLFLVTSNLNSQGIRGGEIWVRAEWSTFALGYVKIYREGTVGKPSILFNWGDGTIDTLQGVTATTLIPGVIVDRYLAFHNYDTTGTYILEVRDSFLVENIVNIPNSEEKELHLRDTFVLPGLPDFFNNLPIFADSQTRISVDSATGAILHNPILDLRDITDSTSMALVSFPVEGYIYPEATDSLVCCFYWNRPTAPGKYALAIRAYDWRFGELVGTATRAMVVEVDASMLVPAFEPLNESSIRLFPIPAFDRLFVKFESIGYPVSIRIYNCFGQEMFQRDVTSSFVNSSFSISVISWPAGLYLLELQVSGQRIIKKFVVQ